MRVSANWVGLAGSRVTRSCCLILSGVIFPQVVEDIEHDGAIHFIVPD